MQSRKNFVDAGEGEDAASYFLRFLFFDIRHVSLMAFIAAFAVWRLRQRPPALKPSRQVVYFTALWWVSLLLVLSLFPVSLSPLRLAMKQSNYITLFMAPMAILAGMGLATLPRLWAAVVGGLSLALGLLLSLLQQADWYAFTANSRAVAAFTLAHPRSLVVGSANNGGMGKLWAESTHPGAPRAKLISFRELQATPDSADLQRGDFDARYTVLDRQTMSWFAGPRPITQPLPCWSNPVRIEPVGLAAGNHVAAALSRSAGWAADAGLKPAGAARDALARLARPQPADIYQVTGPDVLCGPS